MQTFAYIGMMLLLLTSGAASDEPEIHAGNRLLYFSCGTAQQQRSTLNGEWFLQPVLASDTATGQFPSLKFQLSTNRFSGNTGCNTMSGSVKHTDSTLSFNENIRVTKKACTGYNEQAFLQNLLMTNRYVFEDSVLILQFNQTELSRWTRKPSRGVPVRRT